MLFLVYLVYQIFEKNIEEKRIWKLKEIGQIILGLKVKGKINLLHKCIVWVYNKGHKQIEMIGK